MNFPNEAQVIPSDYRPEPRIIHFKLKKTSKMQTPCFTTDLLQSKKVKRIKKKIKVMLHYNLISVPSISVFSHNNLFLSTENVRKNHGIE